MDDTMIFDIPSTYQEIKERGREAGFTMPSDLYTGSLLKTLVSSKPRGKILELGTGTGLALSWIVEGMDDRSRVISVDNDQQLTEIATSFFMGDPRVEIVCQDGAAWLRNNRHERFDLVFADAWPGKYSELDLTLEMLNAGGFYVIDDMLPQPSWPEGHPEKANRLIEILDQRDDLTLTKINWSTGIILAVKRG